MLTEVSYFRQRIWIPKRSWEAGAVYTVFVVDVVYKKKLNRNNWKFLLSWVLKFPTVSVERKRHSFIVNKSHDIIISKKNDYPGTGRRRKSVELFNGYKVSVVKSQVFKMNKSPRSFIHHCAHS